MRSCCVVRPTTSPVNWSTIQFGGGGVGKLDLYIGEKRLEKPLPESRACTPSRHWPPPRVDKVPPDGAAAYPDARHSIAVSMRFRHSHAGECRLPHGNVNQLEFLATWVAKRPGV